MFAGDRPTASRISTALTAILCLAIVFGGTPGFVSGAPGSGERAHRAYVAQEGLAGDVIVVLEDGADIQAAEAVEIAVEAGGEQPTQVFDGAIDGFATTLSASEVAELATDPQVAGIFPDTPITGAAQTLPTGVNRIDADANPTANINGVDTRVNVGVAVFDSGIANHPDLNVAGGKDCSGSDTGDFLDNYAAGHGTHVAGTIGALDNGIGVVGVAPGARLYAVKVLDGSGNGSASNLICGLNWVVANAGPIDIVNMSLTGPVLDSAEFNACGAAGATTPLHQAVCNVVNGAGIPVVAAAGNQGGDAGSYVPGTYPEVITVSGINDSDGQPGNDSRYSSSNSGADVDIAAPAVSILSTTLDGGTGIKSGTSMAAPHVTGAIALSLAGGGGDIFANARFPGEPGGVTGVPEGVVCVGLCGEASQSARISLDRTRSTVNVTLNVAISGFPANANVTVAFVGTTYASSNTVTTNGNGVANAPLVIPATPLGNYTIRATSGSTVANTPFEVAPRIKVTPTTGDPGDTVGVSLRGFGKRESVRIRWKVGSSYVTLTTVTTSNSGSSNVNVQVPNNAPGGPTSVRGDGTVARAQTNLFTVNGGNLRVASEATPDASPGASPVGGTPISGASEATPVATLPEGSPEAEVIEPTPDATAIVESMPDTASEPTESTVDLAVDEETPVPTEAPTETATVAPTDVPTEIPTEIPTEVPTNTPTEVPTETPAPTPTPEIIPYTVIADASSDPAVPGWIAYDDDPATYWEVLAPVALAAEPAGDGTAETVVEPAVGPDGLPLPAASLVLDLGTWLPIGTIRWVYAFEGGADDLRIEVSEDGVYWTPVTYPGQVGNALPGEWQELPLAPGTVGGRYVRFAFENPNGDLTLGGMAEIEVWP